MSGETESEDSTRGTTDMKIFMFLFSIVTTMLGIAPSISAATERAVDNRPVRILVLRVPRNEIRVGLLPKEELSIRDKLFLGQIAVADGPKFENVANPVKGSRAPEQDRRLVIHKVITVENTSTLVLTSTENASLLPLPQTSGDGCMEDTDATNDVVATMSDCVTGDQAIADSLNAQNLY